jgi:outer membrane protein insertion porin family
MKFDDEKHEIDMSYSFEKGSLVHFREIHIVGNAKTHDKVIRRELKINEGELYNGTNLRKSRENVERLGYFAPGEVVFNTITLKDQPELVDIEIKIKERSTGTVTLGAGYGNLQGFFFQTQVSEINLFGRGQVINLSGQISLGGQSNAASGEKPLVGADRQINLGFTDPYALDTHWSAGFDLYSLANSNIPTHNLRKNGGDIRLGHPLFEYTNAFITYKLENTQIDKVKIEEQMDLINSDKGLLSSIVWSIERDKRNNRYETTNGNFQRLSLETAGLGGDKKFIKWSANNRIYFPIVEDLVFRNSVEFGQVKATSERAIPFSEKYYVGGSNLMKGYDPYSLGPKRDGIFIGGEVIYYSLIELEYPLIREAGLKFVAFYDIGNTTETWKDITLRQDAGFGIRWFSPIGPLRFEFGYPINRRPGETSPNFQFMIGPSF